MSTPYEDIFRSFLNKIEDKDLPRFCREEQEELLVGWLNEAMSLMEVRNIKIKSDLQDRDNDYMEFEDDLSYAEIEIIAMLMVAAWFTPKINSLETTLLMTGTSSDRWASQKDHLAGMKSTRDYWISQALKLCRDKNVLGGSYFEE